MKVTSSAIFRHLYGGKEPFSTGFHSAGFIASLFGLPVWANRVQQPTCKSNMVNRCIAKDYIHNKILPFDSWSYVQHCLLQQAWSRMF